VFLIRRLPMTPSRNQRSRFGYLASTALVAACATSGPPSTSPIAIPASGTFHPPKKMGSSVTHSKMCKCRACSPAKCCQGPNEEDESAKKCDQDYDFSKPGCGMQIESCNSRCFEQVWRVSQEASCASKQPQGCCGA